jgi:hypothetical protein
VEEINLIAPNGSLVGDAGYPRGFVPRTAPGFSDAAMTWRLPPTGRVITAGILPDDTMCMPAQQTANQTGGNPRLKAHPGSMVSLHYDENGHVSLPQNQLGKPGNRGTVFVYGTTQPKDHELFATIHKVWNAAGTGGDGRGKLLAAQNFDDGQCHQVNPASAISVARQASFPNPATGTQAELRCQNNIVIPSDVPANSAYTLYWVWDWPTLPGIDPGLPDGKTEIYTTCMDVDIVAGAPPPAGKGVKYAGKESLDSSAVAAYLSKISTGQNIYVNGTEGAPGLKVFAGDGGQTAVNVPASSTTARPTSTTAIPASSVIPEGPVMVYPISTVTSIIFTTMTMPEPAPTPTPTQTQVTEIVYQTIVEYVTAPDPQTVIANAAKTVLQDSNSTPTPVAPSPTPASTPTGAIPSIATAISATAPTGSTNTTSGSACIVGKRSKILDATLNQAVPRPVQKRSIGIRNRFSAKFRAV